MIDLFEVNTQLSRFCRNYMQGRVALPIRPSEMGVLNIICMVPGMHTPVSLADRLCVSRPMISAHINALIKSGFVVRVASPEDARSSYVLPTKKARALVARVRVDTDKMLNDLATQMGEKNFETLVGLVVQANKIFENIS